MNCGICFFVLFACTPRNDGSHKPSDLLDSIKSETELIKDLKDAYRAFKVFHAISEYKEIIRIRMSDLNHEHPTSVGSFTSDTVDASPETYLKKNAEALILTCEKLRGIDISDDSVRTDVDSFISSTIRNARALIEKGFGSREFVVDDSLYLKQSENFQLMHC